MIIVMASILGGGLLLILFGECLVNTALVRRVEARRGLRSY